MIFTTIGYALIAGLSTGMMVNDFLTPTIPLSCEFTNKATKKVVVFSMNSPGSLFKGYSLTKGSFTFGFKLQGVGVLYSMLTKIKGESIDLSKEFPVDLSVPNGYNLRNNVLDMSDDNVVLHCDAVTSKTDIFS